MRFLLAAGKYLNNRVCVERESINSCSCHSYARGCAKFLQVFKLCSTLLQFESVYLFMLHKQLSVNTHFEELIFLFYFVVLAHAGIICDLRAFFASQFQ